jgi:hypothetical protein
VHIRALKKETRQLARANVHFAGSADLLRGQSSANLAEVNWPFSVRFKRSVVDFPDRAPILWVAQQ